MTIIINPDNILADPLSLRLNRHFAKLATIGVQPDGSISRLAYSDAESAAMAFIRAEGEAFGLEGYYDGVGNLILSMPGKFSERILVGSHLDSVPQGGNYDGAAGVVAALEALRSIISSHKPPHCGMDLVVWRGEEHTFNAVYKGSSAAFGLSEPHVLHNLYGNKTLRDAILQQRFDPSYIDYGLPSFEQDYIDSIKAYLELHIEQGACLEQERMDVGIVTSIAGDRRFIVVLEGRFDHSGATPFGARYRCDVNLAMAYIQTGLDKLAQQYQKQKILFTQTVGIVNADAEIDKRYPRVHGNSVTKVSGLGYFTLDIMSPNDKFLDDYSAEVHRLIWRTSREFGVASVIEQTDATSGIEQLNQPLQALLESAAQKQKATYKLLPSGAGHDAVIVAQAKKSDLSPIPTGMLFIPCRHGISHDKEEFVSADQVAKGCVVLQTALEETAQKTL